MICQKCNRPNRQEARFCKWCGEKVSAETIGECSQLNLLVEKDEIASKLKSIVSKAKIKADFCRRNGIKERMQLSFVITGDAGSGKTETAKTIATLLYDAGITRSAVPVTVNPVNFREWIKDSGKYEKQLSNSVVIFEQAQKLIGDGDATEINDIDYLLQPIRNWRDQGDKPVVIITGDLNLREYFHKHRQAASAIDYFFETDDLSVDGLLEIALLILKNKYCRSLTDKAVDKLKRILMNDARNPADALGAGGHNAAARAYQIDLAAVDGNTTENLLDENYVVGKEFYPKTIDEVMAEFDRYVGVEEVKQAVMTVANTIAKDIKAGREPKIENHYRFIGNPGTGKTTMARLFAEALNALGALPVGQLVEVSKNELTSEYVGETPKQVAAQFKKAMGGVLFIDEAYQLGNDSHGKDAIDTIITLAENNRGKLVVILAGYSKEMAEFFQLNSGLESRFNQTIEFRDYSGEELAEIFRRMVKGSPDSLRLAPDAEEGVDNFFKKMYLNKTDTFGNAREVRNTFTKAIERMHNRCAKDPSLPEEITMTDIEGEKGSLDKSIEEILSSLDDLVGMDSVKSTLADIAAGVQISKMQMEAGGTDPELFELHIAITGNPGTGKTVVAKRLGEIFKAIGVLTKGHVVERERKTLLDSMANSAGQNMDKAVNEALGGILFIDEAYNLIPMNNPSDKDRDGVAAVEALMTRMVKDAGKFITVIAGYKAEIDEFIANANPGLASRFSHRIHIDDYTPSQLCEIFVRHANSKKFRLTEEAQALLQKKIDEMVTMKDKNFGNARTVLKLFDKTRERMSKRLRANLKGTLTQEMLFTIEASDIPYEAPRRVDIQECFRELDQLVGLDSVKNEIRNLASAITVEQERAEAEGRKPEISLDHYLFLGNPGTGKTTVARIMGNIFYSLGLLPSNKLLEVKPTDLISGYMGQTGAKTRQMVERGVGGVFFIDEAYGLNDGGYGANESTRELLTLLNDYRGRLVCVAAGYPREMRTWMNVNSGVKRRFTRTINFEDYSEDDLAKIFLNIVRKNGMRLEEDADKEMRRYFRVLVFNKDTNFGNAAEAVNYFNRVKINQGARLRESIKTEGFNREELYILKFEDMLIKEI